MKSSPGRCLTLLLVSVIWGSAFVAQALGMEHVGPFAFTFGRSLAGGLFLLAVIPFIDRLEAKNRHAAAGPWKSRTLWTGGVLCGLCLFTAESFQQFGLLQTTVGKAGFITGLYIVIVPAIGFILGRVKGLKIWAAVAAATAGLWLLCLPSGGTLDFAAGDLLVLACAFAFSFHILVIDRFAPFVDCVRMSCIQFFTGSALGGIMTMIFERPSPESFAAAAAAILYAGILSNGVAYTLQIIGQKGVNPTLASLIMSLESVFAVVFGWLIMGETLTSREAGGCLLMAAAIVIAQVPGSAFGNLLPGGGSSRP